MSLGEFVKSTVFLPNESTFADATSSNEHAHDAIESTWCYRCHTGTRHTTDSTLNGLGRAFAKEGTGKRGFDIMDIVCYCGTVVANPETDLLMVQSMLFKAIKARQN